MSLLRYNFMIEAVECYKRVPEFLKDYMDDDDQGDYHIAIWMLGALSSYWFSRVDKEEIQEVDVDILCIMLPAIRKQARAEQEETDA